MRAFLIMAFAIFARHDLWGQAGIPRYDAAAIPEKLKKDADAVNRLNEGVLEIISPSRYIFTTRQVVTLLNREAAHHLRQTLHYDKFEKIDNVVFKIFDAGGSLVRSYQKKDFNTKDYLDGMSLYTDDKLLYLEAAAPGYPCTVEITCIRKTSGYTRLPDWVIAPPEEAVEYSHFVVKAPVSPGIKYRVLNIDIEPVIRDSAGVKIYTWVAKDITASRPEPGSYRFHYLPRIEVVPNAFEYDGYKGELKSWQAFGAWNYQFYEDERPFTAADIKRIASLVANCKTDREKIDVLYRYLQQTVRYVSIQLGIGGFKPFPVKYVNDKRYGDCKALTNFMRYMLKTVGITAYPALINAGYNRAPADINFPSDPFNHVILCVPMERDSIWLECTSNNNECGFLGHFTENKNALLLTEQGGVLVPTPKSKYANNILSTKSIITLDEDGGSDVVSEIFCSGEFWDFFYDIMKQTEDEKKDIFVNYLHYKMPEQFKIEAKQDSLNGKRFSLTLSYDQQYDFKTGSKLFLKPRLAPLSDEDIQRVPGRKLVYLFDFPYHKSDTTVYVLPSGMAVDKLPAKKELSNEYASYTSEYIKNENGTTLTFAGSLLLKKSIVPPDDYLKVADFFQEVNRLENEKLIIRKN